jgi:hypothetical protein
MTIEEPAGATWRVEELAEASRANAKPGILKRLTFLLRPAPNMVSQVVMKVL